MIDKVGVKAAFFNLLRCEIARQLVHDGGDHLHVRKLFRADVRQNALAFLIRHGIPLVEVAHGRTQLAVRAAKLRDNNFGGLRIRILDLYRKLQSFIV